MNLQSSLLRSTNRVSRLWPAARWWIMSVNAVRHCLITTAQRQQGKGDLSEMEPERNCWSHS
jgi:hypothetical protein